MSVVDRIIARITDPFRRAYARLLLVVDRSVPIARPGMPALKARVLARIAARNTARRRRRELKRSGRRVRTGFPILWEGDWPPMMLSNLA